MNVSGHAVEEAAGRDLMPGFHAGWSIGTVVGAGAGALAARADLDPAWHFGLASLVLAGCGAGRGPVDADGLQAEAPSTREGEHHVPGPTGRADPGPAAARARRHDLLRGVGRGVRQRLAGADARRRPGRLRGRGRARLRGVRRRDDRGAARGHPGGHPVRPGAHAARGCRWSRRPASSCCSPCPVLAVGYLGALLWGLGIAMAFPLAMSAAGETPAAAPSAIATVATIAYSGFLVGPPLIGTIAHAIGLDNALWLVLALAAGIFVLAGTATHPRPGARLRACPRTSTARCSSCAPCCSTPTTWSAPSRPASAGRRRRRGGGPSCGRSTSRTAGTCRWSPTTSARPPRPTRRTATQAEAEVDALLAQPFGNWHVQTTTETLQLRVTKKGLAQLHRKAEPNEQHTEHDRAAHAPDRPGRPAVLGAGCRRRQATAGRRVPARAAGGGRRGGPARRPAAAGRRPRLRQRLPHLRGLPVPRRAATTCGSPASTSGRRRASATTRWPRSSAGPTRCASSPATSSTRRCPTATGSTSCSRCTPATRPPTTPSRRPCAGTRQWSSPRRAATTTCSGRCRPAARRSPYGLVARHAILRERLGDVLTDAVRAALLRRVGYRVEVVQFVSAEYTPRNTMIRAVRAAGALPDPAADADYDALVRRLGRDAAPADAARRRPCPPLARRGGRCRRDAAGGGSGPQVVLTMQDPDADRVERAGARRPATPTCCGRTTTAADRPGLRRRRRRRHRSRTSRCAASTPTTPRRWRPAWTPTADRRCSSATSATTWLPAPDVSVFRFAEPTTLADATCPRRGSASPTRTARTTPRRCSSARGGRIWSRPRRLGRRPLPRAAKAGHRRRRAPTG